MSDLVLNLLGKLGAMWKCNEPVSDKDTWEKWNTYKKETCYRVETNDMYFSSKSYYESCLCDFISAKDFLKKHYEFKANIPIHCKTYDESIEVLKIADALGYTWGDGKTYLTANNWNNNREHSLYYIKEGYYGDNRVLKTGYNVIEASDFLNLIEKINTNVECSYNGMVSTVEKELVVIPPEGYEIDKDNSTFELIKFKKIFKKTWDDYFLGKKISGFRITPSRITQVNFEEAKTTEHNVFNSELDAISALALAKISQLMVQPDYNGDWIPNWNRSEESFIIIRSDNSLRITSSADNYFTPLCFKDKKKAEKFLFNFEDILKEYYYL